MARLMLTFSLLYLCHAREILQNVNSTVSTTSQKSTQIVPFNEPVCKKNMVKYPVENKSDICDCRTGYLYYELEDECYPPFKKGPCSNSEYLVYNQTTQIATCIPNPCKEEGVVLYEGMCYELNTIGEPCKKDEILNINEEKFTVQCETLTIDTRRIFQAPLRECPAGSRRNARGICRVVISE